MAKLPAHGTERRYWSGPDENDRPGKGCRCNACTPAATKAAKLRRLRGPGLTDAEPVRQHVQALKSAGMTYMSAAKVAGVHDKVMTRLMYGEPAAGWPPSRRIRREYAEALLAVRAHHHDGSGYVLAAGTVRRLRALARNGWPARVVAEHTGVHANHLNRLANGTAGPTVLVETARKVAAAYRQFENADPAAWGVSPAKARQVQTLAAKRGWHPPAAWDDDLLDLSEEDLAAELRRQAEQMSDLDVGRAHAARWRLGDTTPLTVAASIEHRRRQRARQELGEAS